MTPSASDIFDLIDRSWPPAARTRQGVWTIRQGLGGSKRTMAATAHGPVSANELAKAEASMVDLGQPAMVQVRGDNPDLDALLAKSGYDVVDPCTIYSIPASDLAAKLPLVTAWIVPDRLACQTEVWAKGGIDAGRLMIMDRAPHPKTTILGRAKEAPVGAAFVAGSADLAMIHAVEVLGQYRRHGVARHMMTAAANWCVAQGITYLTLICTTQNIAANALYASLGMQVVGQYHYRIKE